MLTQENVVMAFGTPISSYLWPDSDSLNADLRALMLGREASGAGLQRSNVGGWHSTPDMMNWQEPCITPLRERIVAMGRNMLLLANARGVKDIASFRIHCWGNVSRNGNYNNIHDHPGADWSGVYYVSRGMPANDDPNNGMLELFDPRLGINMVGRGTGYHAGRLIFDPIPGLMVLFPSWLKHMVHPFFGEGERISISFNLTILNGS